VPSVHLSTAILCPQISFHGFRENVRAALISHTDEAAMNSLPVNSGTGHGDGCAPFARLKKAHATHIPGRSRRQITTNKTRASRLNCSSLLSGLRCNECHREKIRSNSIDVVTADFRNRPANPEHTIARINGNAKIREHRKMLTSPRPQTEILNYKSADGAANYGEPAKRFIISSQFS
jgi:hypothetical protein